MFSGGVTFRTCKALDSDVAGDSAIAFCRSCCLAACVGGYLCNLGTRVLGSVGA